MSEETEAAPEHVPDQPSWNCRVDGLPWPCEQARKEMLATHSETELAIHLWTMFEDAVQDLAGMGVKETIERFITWPRRRS